MGYLWSSADGGEHGTTTLDVFVYSYAQQHYIPDRWCVSSFILKKYNVLQIFGYLDLEKKII